MEDVSPGKVVITVAVGRQQNPRETARWNKDDLTQENTYYGDKISQKDVNLVCALRGAYYDELIKYDQESHPRSSTFFLCV